MMSTIPYFTRRTCMEIRDGTKFDEDDDDRIPSYYCHPHVIVMYDYHRSSHYYCYIRLSAAASPSCFHQSSFWQSKYEVANSRTESCSTVASASFFRNRRCVLCLQRRRDCIAYFYWLRGSHRATLAIATVLRVKLLKTVNKTRDIWWWGYQGYKYVQQHSHDSLLGTFLPTSITSW